MGQIIAPKLKKLDELDAGFSVDATPVEKGLSIKKATLFIKKQWLATVIIVTLLVAYGGYQGYLKFTDAIRQETGAELVSQLSAALAAKGDNCPLIEIQPAKRENEAEADWRKRFWNMVNYSCLEQRQAVAPQPTPLPVEPAVPPVQP